MRDNLSRAKAYIDCYNKEHPNSGSACCFGPTGPTGAIGPTGPQGIPGPTGPQGIPGPTGASPLTVGIAQTVTTEPGSIATVTNVGSDTNMVLEFTIPQGSPGETGPTGPSGVSMIIKGSYSSIDELIAEHPVGSLGDSYIIGSRLYVWQDDNWVDVGRIGGPQGEIGPQGVQGPQGEMGPQGIMGVPGIQGPVGPVGPQGPQGLKGDTGLQGEIGPTGPAGASVTILGSYSTFQDLEGAHPTGSIGDSYLVGDYLYVWSNEDGNWKNVGVIRGPQGIQGPPGPKGDTGLQGDVGPQGPQGDIGPQGIQGPQGEQGIPGPQGEQGLQGIPGPAGQPGPQGIPGIQGPPGPQELSAGYLVGFNYYGSSVVVPNMGRLPISRIETDNNNLFQLFDNTIIFNKGGLYEVNFIAYVYMPPSENVDLKQDFVSIGFKKRNEDIVYAGGSAWTNNGSTVIMGQGLFVIAHENEEMELVNMSNREITLNTPALINTSSTSYHINPLVTIIIKFLA